MHLLLLVIQQISKKLNISQFGADVVISKSGECYLLELNENMGLAGEVLEKQGVAKKYTESFVQRLQEHQKEKHPKQLCAMI